MSSLPLSPRPQKSQGTDWAARLIPGAAAHYGYQKKPPTCTKQFLSQETITVPAETKCSNIFWDILPNLALGANQNQLDSSLADCAFALFVWFLVAGIITSLLRAQGYPSTVIAIIWSAGILHFCLLSAWHWAWRDTHKHGARANGGSRNVLIVGAGALGRQIASNMGKHPELGCSVCGFLDDRKPLGNGVVGRTSDLMEVARSLFADEIILTPPHDPEVTLCILHTARQLRLNLKIAPDLFGCEPFSTAGKTGNIPLISLHEEKLPVAQLLLKRALDVTTATVGLILLAPVFILISILIKMDSRGTVLYAASRGGYKGKPFLCYKFRTMVNDADDRKEGLQTQNEREGPFFKITDDPRVTRIGKFLRRYSLDELPQLWNVLRGEMSMVGPRPHPLDDVSEYGIEHLARLDVLPGITGLWQVIARHDPSFETSMRLDIEYIRCWSLKMDLHILLKTAGAVLRGSGT
jgi:exopolysaccharide biosynthesis polyprenyl glycosylphosphotransferase